MSIEASTRVWLHSKAEGTELLVMLCLANYANDDNETWPSIPTISRRARVNKRTVQRLIRRLETLGEIEHIGMRGKRADKRTRAYLITVPEGTEERGDKLPPRPAERGDTTMPPRSEERGDIPVLENPERGDMAVSPDPSGTDNPSGTDIPVGEAQAPRELSKGWNQPFIDAWLTRMGGTAPAARITNAIRPLAKAHGEPEVLERWTDYLKTEKPRFASAETFAQKYGAIASDRADDSTASTDRTRTERPPRGKESVPRAGSNRYDRKLTRPNTDELPAP